MFWGSPTQVSSLCFMREVIRRQQVDKGVMVFNTGDEFLLHVFKAHFKASIMPILNVQTSSDNIPHQSSQQWLRSVADNIVSDVLMPATNTNPVYSFHRSHNYVYVHRPQRSHQVGEWASNYPSLEMVAACDRLSQLCSRSS